MHVVHVVPTLSGGGAETLVRSIIPRLAAAGLELSVVSIYAPDLDPDERAMLGAPLYEIGRRGALDGPRAFVKTVALLRELRADIVHGHVHTGKYFGRAAALAAGVPRVLYTEHHSLPEHTPAQRFADRALLPWTDAVIAFHERQRQVIAQRDGIPLERIAVVPNGIEFAPATGPGERALVRRKLGIGAETFVVLFAGRLAEVKFPELAIDAFAAMPGARDGDDLLLIAGDGPLALDIETRSDRLLGPRVRRLGYRRDMLDLYAAADAFLMTSRNEAMPLAPIEAMSQGVPVVTTPWDGANEIVRDGVGGYVTKAYDAEEIGIALALLRDMPACRRALAARAADLARSTYDIGRTIERHCELYTLLLGGRS